MTQRRPIRSNLAKLSVIFLSVIALIQCSDSGSSNLVFGIQPKQPVVILADYDNGVDVINAPWFKIKIGAINKDTTRTITIQSLVLKASTTNAFGTKVTNSTTVDPGDYGRSYLLEVPPGATPVALSDLYVDGLPNSPSNVYEVEVEVQGWYGANNDPQESLGRVTFTFTAKP